MLVENFKEINTGKGFFRHYPESGKYVGLIGSIQLDRESKTTCPKCLGKNLSVTINLGTSHCLNDNCNIGIKLVSDFGVNGFHTERKDFEYKKVAEYTYFYEDGFSRKKYRLEHKTIINEKGKPEKKFTWEKLNRKLAGLNYFRAEQITDSHSIIYIVEGEKKCLALQKYLTDNNLNGLSISIVSTNKDQILPNKTTLKKLTGKYIILIPDVDTKESCLDKSKNSFIYLSNYLLKNKIEHSLLDLKSYAKFSGYDIDDFLSEHPDKFKVEIDKLSKITEPSFVKIESSQNDNIEIQLNNYIDIDSKIIEAIKGRFNIYYNEISHEYEMDKQTEITIESEHEILKYVRKKLKNDSISSTRIRECYMDFNVIEKYNPLIEYFRSLENRKIEGNPILFLYLLLTGKQFTDIESNKYLLDNYQHFKSYFCLLAGLSAGYEVNDYKCLILRGASGTGKTGIVRKLVPAQLKKYYVDTFTDFESKDAKIRLTNSFLINLDEIGESSKQDLKKLKSLITLQSIKERLSYGRRDQNLKRWSSFIGSFDKDTVFTDDANRRFIVVEVQKVDFEKLEKSFNVDDFYAQAIQCYIKNDFKQHFDSDLIDRNRDYENTTIEYELLVSMLHQGDLFGDMTTTDVMKKMIDKNGDLVNKISDRKIGSALSKMGYERKSKRVNGRGLKVYSF